MFFVNKLTKFIFLSRELQMQLLYFVLIYRTVQQTILRVFSSTDHVQQTVDCSALIYSPTSHTNTNMVRGLNPGLKSSDENSFALEELILLSRLERLCERWLCSFFFQSICTPAIWLDIHTLLLLDVEEFTCNWNCRNWCTLVGKK